MDVELLTQDGKSLDHQPMEPEPQSQPEAPSQSAQGPEPDFDAIQRELGPEPTPQADTSRLFDRTEFAEHFFIGGLNISSALTGYKSLAVGPDPEHTKALEAGGAIYDTILEYPTFHWLISKDTKYLGRAMVIGAFVIPKAQAVALEMQMRRAPRPAPAAPSQKTDKDAPPEGVIPMILQ